MKTPAKGEADRPLSYPDSTENLGPRRARLESRRLGQEAEGTLQHPTEGKTPCLLCRPRAAGNCGARHRHRPGLRAGEPHPVCYYKTVSM